MENKKYLIVILIILGSLIFIYQSKYALISYIIINIIFYFNFLDKKKEQNYNTVIYFTNCVFFSLSSSRIIVDNFKKQS